MIRPFAALAALLTALPANAQFNALILQAVPTLDEVGLGVLGGLVGAAAGWSLGRRKRRK